MWEGIDCSFGFGNPNAPQEFNGEFLSFGFRSAEVLADMFVHLSANFDYGVERSHWVLENHCYFLTPEVSHFAHRKIKQVFAEKVDVSGRVDVVSEVQPHDGA